MNDYTGRNRLTRPWIERRVRRREGKKFGTGPYVVCSSVLAGAGV
jgi:hypothetical protein